MARLAFALFAACAVFLVAAESEEKKLSAAATPAFPWVRFSRPRRLAPRKDLRARSRTVRAR